MYETKCRAQGLCADPIWRRPRFWFPSGDRPITVPAGALGEEAGAPARCRLTWTADLTPVASPPQGPGTASQARQCHGSYPFLREIYPWHGISSTGSLQGAGVAPVAVVSSSKGSCRQFRPWWRQAGAANWWAASSAAVVATLSIRASALRYRRGGRPAASQAHTRCTESPTCGWCSKCLGMPLVGDIPLGPHGSAPAWSQARMPQACRRQ